MLLLTQNNEQEDDEAAVARIEKKVNVTEPNGERNTHLSADPSIQSNFAVCRMIKMKLKSSLKILEMKCPSLKTFYGILVFLPILETVFAELALHFFKQIDINQLDIGLQLFEVCFKIKSF